MGASTQNIPESPISRAQRAKQDKSVASCAAPLTTSARSAGSLRGTRVRSQIQKKLQIEVTQGPYPPVPKLWDDVFGPKRRDYDE